MSGFRILCSTVWPEPYRGGFADVYVEPSVTDHAISAIDGPDVDEPVPVLVCADWWTRDATIVDDELPGWREGLRRS